MIASSLGIHPSEIWPNQYFDDNGHSIKRIIRKFSTEQP
ncbi:helix-turn-helix domain-containing protein [Photorhabdus asymbiotica]